MQARHSKGEWGTRSSPEKRVPEQREHGGPLKFGVLATSAKSRQAPACDREETGASWKLERSSPGSEGCAREKLCGR